MAIVFSRDQRYVYIVAEQAGSDSTWPAACPQNLPAKKKRADEALVVPDTTKFVTDPEHVKVATVPVGKSSTGSTLMDGGAKIIVSNIERWRAAIIDSH